MFINIHKIVPSFFKDPIGIFKLDGNGFYLSSHEVMEDVFIKMDVFMKIYNVNITANENYSHNVGHLKWPYYSYVSYNSYLL